MRLYQHEARRLFEKIEFPGMETPIEDIDKRAVKITKEAK